MVSDDSDFREFLGLTIEQANEGAPNFGINAIRAVLIDGEECMVTSDFRFDRLNVELENNKITRIRGIG